MQIILLKSKLHRATVTGACVDYEGSLTISEDIAETVFRVVVRKGTVEIHVEDQKAKK